MSDIISNPSHTAAATGFNGRADVELVRSQFRLVKHLKYINTFDFRRRQNLSTACKMSFHAIIRRLIGSPASRATEEAIFRTMVEQSGDVICYLVNGRFTYVSPSASTVFGWLPNEMIGTDGMHLIYPPDLPDLRETLARRMSGEVTEPISHQLRVICGDGSLKWSETSSRSETEGRGGETRTILVIRDISDRKRLEEELKALAHRDGLTGVANRRAFDKRLEKTWHQTLRQGTELALLLLDIDCFKQFNDLYGHQAGDDCLRAVARVLSRFARRRSDLACRYGGEEFALVLGDTTSYAAIGIAEEIRLSVAALDIPHEASTGTDHVTVSIGVATAVARPGSPIRMPEGLLQLADHALYKAKTGGRNRVEQSLLMPQSAKGSFNGPRAVDQPSVDRLTT